MESDLNELYEQIQLLEKQVGVTASLPASSRQLTLDEAPTDKSDRRSVAISTSRAPNGDDPVFSLLLYWCFDSLPPSSVAWELISVVTKTYSADMYIVDYNDLETCIQNIYSYFSEFNNSDQIQHAVSEAPTPSTLCYFFSLLGLGQQLQNTESSPNEEGIASVPGQKYFVLASRLFQFDFDQISFTYIQSCILLGLICCNLNRYNTTYNYFGIAVLSAVVNGYHRQIEVPSFLNEADRRQFLTSGEKKKRLWWTIFYIDVIWAARMNMPAHIEFTDTDVALPSEMPYDLHDHFDNDSLESNVQLIKYVAKFNKLIYGPSLRTFSVNYINTDKFNQDRLVGTIISSLNEISVGFELSFLNQCKDRSIVSEPNRNLANIFSRFNQLIILVVEPLLSVVFNPNSASLVENNREVFGAIVKGIRAAYTSVNMFWKLFEHGKLFVFGFWDSQHLFSAFTLLVLVLIAGFPYKEHNRIVALLKYMAEHKNISAKRYLEKIEAISIFIGQIPEAKLQLNLNASIHDYVRKDPSTLANEFYNPFCDENLYSAEFLQFFNLQPSNLLYEHFGFDAFSPQSQSTLWSMSKSIQKWSNYSGLPIPVSGINKSLSTVRKTGEVRSVNDCSINALIRD